MIALDSESGSNNAWLSNCLQKWGIEKLTDIQLRALKAGIAEGKSLIISAPTSSGKTLVGEIAVAVALHAGTRAIYLVSHKALADQKFLDFQKRFGEKADSPIASVGLNTGDRAEGDIDARLLVATYEKALGLILSGQLDPSDSLIIADELQILGESGRGPEIESLCGVLRQRGPKQFVALTATVENPQDLAGWMNCDLVRSHHRDVPLHQEIWYSNRVFRQTFGKDEGKNIDIGAIPDASILKVVEKLLGLDRGPVLAFTETRKEAADFAAALSRSRPRSGDGIAIAEQLDLFSEPTESSENLKNNAEKRVAFHTADLSPQERQVIEAGFMDSKFEVCFATSTLAAGVNFPFKSIVFSRLTYRYGDRSGQHISRGDYRNMSGRAGRLGMHDEGYAVIVPRDEVELSHGKKLIAPENDKLSSQLVNLSLRKSILMLIASRLATSADEVLNFFKNTLYWYQTLDKNPKKLEQFQSACEQAVQWLIENKFLKKNGQNLIVTPFGNATASTGLLPATALQLSKMLLEYGPQFQKSIDEWTDGIIYTVCASEEFCGERPSRFMPWPSRPGYDSTGFWSSKKLPTEFDHSNYRLSQCAHAMALYVTGLAERKIAHATGVSSGATHRLAIDVAWILEGLQKLSTVPEFNCPQTIGNQISLLSRRVRWGAPTETLDVIRVAERHGVPGFGRQRAMTLIAQGIATIHDVVTAGVAKLADLVRGKRRAQALFDAASGIVGLSSNRLVTTHLRLGKELGIENHVNACNTEIGIQYEKAIETLLRVEESWVVTVIDDGKKQNVPDLLIRLGDIQIIIECKTCITKPPLIKKEDAWAVIQKAADFDAAMRRVTLGKPAFDETSKLKAAASKDITLVEHAIFMEGLLRVHAGNLSPKDFLLWIGTPGVSEIERLGGTPTYIK